MRIRLGITGGIGSGKSFFSKALRERGIPVFDSDSEAKKLMLMDNDIITSLKALLGDDVYINGEINKPLLASYIFASGDNASRVNSIVHPCVKKAFLRWADECFSAGHHIAAIESAILFESGFDDIVNRVVMVHAPLETRIARVMERDKTTRDKVIVRINSQMDDHEKLSKSDFIIENDGTASIDSQIDKLISDLHLIKDVQYLV